MTKSQELWLRTGGWVETTSLGDDYKRVRKFNKNDLTVFIKDEDNHVFTVGHYEEMSPILVVLRELYDD